MKFKPFQQKPKPVPVPVAPTDFGFFADRVFILVNGERRKASRPEFKRDLPALDALAQSWADWMAAHHTMDHGDFAKRFTPKFPRSNGGENIAAGYPTPESVVVAWMNSPGHRANILGQFASIGIGIAQAAGLIYWCTDFAGKPIQLPPVGFGVIIPERDWHSLPGGISKGE